MCHHPRSVRKYGEGRGAFYSTWCFPHKHSLTCWILLSLCCLLWSTLAVAYIACKHEKFSGGTFPILVSGTINYRVNRCLAEFSLSPTVRTYLFDGKMHFFSLSFALHFTIMAICWAWQGLVNLPLGKWYICPAHCRQTHASCTYLCLKLPGHWKRLLQGLCPPPGRAVPSQWVQFPWARAGGSPEVWEKRPSSVLLSLNICCVGAFMNSIKMK